jgi:hypothetical protein
MSSYHSTPSICAEVRSIFSSAVVSPGSDDSWDGIQWDTAPQIVGREFLCLRFVKEQEGLTRDVVRGVVPASGRTAVIYTTLSRKGLS